MSNSYFQFKQFRINQDKCGMKVSTDSCIQGAWAPVADNVKHVLDIGAGTGLLSLMLAQRNANIEIEAIELDEAAATQARENVAASPWADRISVLQGDVRNYNFGKKYDLIICNPPFFQNSLKGDDAGRNHARHNLALSFEDILTVMKQYLQYGGYGCILLPVAEHLLWEKLLQENGWTISLQLNISPLKARKPNRVISVCSVSDVLIVQNHLHIYDDKNVYSEEFEALLKTFYLSL